MNPTLAYIQQVNKITALRKAAGLCPRCGENPLGPEDDKICMDCEYEEQANEDYV